MEVILIERVGGRGVASFRHGAFIREGRLIQPVTLKRGRLLDKRRLFESGSLIELSKGRVKGSYAQFPFPSLRHVCHADWRVTGKK